MESVTINAARLLPNATDPAVADVAIRVSNGRIAAIEQSTGKGDGLVLPALANAHDHARFTRLSQSGSFDVPLEAWLPYLSLIPSVDPWLSSVVSFARSALGGAGAIMAHYTRVQGLTDFPTEAKAVARAARDVGVRVALAIHCRDRSPIVYGPHDKLLKQLSPAACACVNRRFLRAPMPPAQQVAMVEAVAAEIEGASVTVQYGPAGVQWCTDAMLEGIAEASARSGRRVHMHLLETRYQRAWADQNYPNGIVHHLDRIGLVNERVSFAHCIWLRPEEMEIIADRGATIVSNTSSNLIVSSGIAPLAEMLRRGCRIAMGLDGLAFDEDEDALREMRLGYVLHKGLGFETRMSRAQLLQFALANNRFVVTGETDGGKIAPGAPADLLILDWNRLVADIVEPDVPAIDLLLGRARREHIKDLFVAGRKIVAGGKLVSVDLPNLERELLSVLRAALHSTEDVRSAMPELRDVIRAHYGEPMYCV
ncbi:MAG: amidohydrolase family protein [Xanthobacteraceae bacterium]